MLIRVIRVQLGFINVLDIMLDLSEYDQDYKRVILQYLLNTSLS
jgi:hypothetical protein